MSAGRKSVAYRVGEWLGALTVILILVALVLLIVLGIDGIGEVL